MRKRKVENLMGKKIPLLLREGDHYLVACFYSTMTVKKMGLNYGFNGLKIFHGFLIFLMLNKIKNLKFKNLGSSPE